MLSLEAMLVVLLWIVACGAIFGLLWWGLAKVNLAEPFASLARAVLVIATIVVAIYLVLAVLPPLPRLR